MERASVVVIALAMSRVVRKILVTLGRTIVEVIGDD
jgi:hypothetical protein